MCQKSNKGDNKIGKQELSFSNMTYCLDTPHITMEFHLNIPKG